MKRSSSNGRQVSVSEVPTLERCCICQERTLTRTTIQKTCIGTPPILVKDLLKKCFESPENFRKVIRDEHADNYLCNYCEISLGEFYDALLRVSSKRTEFLSRILQNSDSPIEYFVFIESASTALSHESFKHVSDDKLEPYASEEDFIDDSCDEYITLNTSDEEFVKVFPADEEFQDDWSSNCSNDFQVLQDGEKETRKPLITIERMPKTKLRYCWRCDKNFPSDDVFEVHLKQIHTKNKRLNISSRKCQKSYGGEEHSLHILKEQKSTSLQCEICTAEFDSTLLSQSHVNAHKERPSAKIMSTPRTFQRRRANNSLPIPNVRNFICAVCDFEFRTAWNLKRHQKLHCLGNISRNSR